MSYPFSNTMEYHNNKNNKMKISIKLDNEKETIASGDIELYMRKIPTKLITLTKQGNRTYMTTYKIVEVKQEEW